MTSLCELEREISRKMDLVTVLQRLQTSAMNIIKTGKKRRQLIKEFRRYSFPEKNNAMEKEKDVEQKTQNMSLQSLTTSPRVADQRKVHSDQSDLGDLGTQNQEISFENNNYSILDSYGEDFEDKSTQINNLHSNAFPGHRRQLHSGKTKPPRQRDSDKEEESIILKVTSEGKQLKKQLRFNVSNRRIATPTLIEPKMKLMKCVNKVNMSKSFCKIVLGKVRMRKRDQEFKMAKFTPTNFRNLFHLQLR